MGALHSPLHRFPGTVPRRGFAAAGLMALAALAGASRALAPGAGPEVHARTFLSRPFLIDRVYRSMKGPWDDRTFHLLESGPKELLWIVGFEAEMVGPDGETRMPADYMCHSNLDLSDAEAYSRRMGLVQVPNGRLFTLSQGQLGVELPEGFGVPMMSDEPLYLVTQVLNLVPGRPPAAVRHKVTVRYLRDVELREPPRALFPATIYGMTLVEGGSPYYACADPDAGRHGPGCLTSRASATDRDFFTDDLGNKFTGHWVVPPGREENRTLVTGLLALPYDTTLHHVAVHLHPFAESLELRDLTTGKTLFRSQATNFTDRVGLEQIEALTSAPGIPVYRDHEYELVSVYENTCGEDVDSMAVMYLFLLDKEFDRTKVAAGGELGA